MWISMSIYLFFDSRPAFVIDPSFSRVTFPATKWLGIMDWFDLELRKQKKSIFPTSYAKLHEGKNDNFFLGSHHISSF